jgi:ParB family chromosome partitioning protein
MTATADNPVTPTETETPEPSRSRSALPGKRGTLIHVPVDDLSVITDKKHPLYDPRIEDALDPAFVANIASQGVQVPVLVAKIKVDGVVSNVVIDGKQRLRAAREAGIETIPAIIVKGDTHALFSLIVLTNENRREDTPLAKARKVARFIALYIEEATHQGAQPGDASVRKRSKEQAALIFGTTSKTIDARLKLLDTAPAVQRAVEANRIGWWAASEFAGLPVEDQEKAIEELVAEGGSNGGKPGVEDAKRKANKGDARRREKIVKTLADLKEAATAYGDAVAEESGIREVLDALKTAALLYRKATNAPRKA